MKILCVDNNEQKLGQLKYGLENLCGLSGDHDITVALVSDYRDIFDNTKYYDPKNPPDVVISDYQFDYGLTGIEFANDLRQRGFENPIVIYSSALKEHITEWEQNLGLNLQFCQQAQWETLGGIIRNSLVAKHTGGADETNALQNHGRSMC